MKIILWIFLFFSCSSRPEPVWIHDRPILQDYWFGIGVISKPFYGENIRFEARNQAITEIASQISIDIFASYEEVISENNFSIDEFAQSIIKARTENTLSDIETIDSYETKSEYYFLARLSKKTYYEAIEKQRNKAINAALDFILKAESRFSSATFGYLDHAMTEIFPYSDIPITIESPIDTGKMINVYNYIKLLTTTMLNNIQLIPNKEIFEMKPGLSRDVQIGVKVLDQNNIPIEKIPIQYSINNIMQSTSLLSNSKGQCSFSLSEVKDLDPIQYINFHLDLLVI